eukprot:scaffold825_cov196-Alexandrium_tamarense.AAC.2
MDQQRTPSNNGSALRSRLRGSFTPNNASSPASPENMLNDEDFDDDAPLGSYATNQHHNQPRYGYRVYPERWLMLFYLSLLNLLSDWAGLSVAPIATLTSRAYNSEDGGDVDNANYDSKTSYIQPEALITTFLIASSIGTALEPWILGRLGLRRTVVFGAFANMLGSLVKSGGLPPISFLSVSSMQSGLYGTYALYLGFFLVGFAQPLFQCTPALLSASWFAEEERTLATSIALNANQLGVGMAFVVGALYVQSPSQVANYFSLLSFFSVAAFVGCVLQLEDAPPTPPSGSSRIMRGTWEISVRDLIQRASSSLLVGGDYDMLTKACANNNWGYRGDDGDVAADSTSVAGGTTVEASAKSLLSQHIRSSPRRGSTNAFSEPWSPALLAASYSVDESIDYYEGAEPTVTQTPHHLEIDIRDDQVLLAAKACFARKGFSHALVVFTVAGGVINTLSTYLDYLVRLSYNDNNSGDYDNNNMNANIEQSDNKYSASVYVALIGGLFQVIIMVSSIVVGSFTDKTRSYFFVTLALLVFGAVALAECGVSLDEDRGGDVRWSLLLVSGLLGPLLPVATELGVEMAYPLSENTVLVILQLSCNLFSAIFIPVFQAVRNVGVTAVDSTSGDDDGAAMVLGSERPQYTFSFYLLILLCAVSTVYFATFDGKYLRLRAELAKKHNDNLEQRSLALDSRMV